MRRYPAFAETFMEGGRQKFRTLPTERVLQGEGKLIVLEQVGKWIPVAECTVISLQPMLTFDTS